MRTDPAASFTASSEAPVVDSCFGGAASPPWEPLPGLFSTFSFSCAGESPAAVSVPSGSAVSAGITMDSVAPAPFRSFVSRARLPVPSLARRPPSPVASRRRAYCCAIR
eukprot:scaffold91_cov254-Pinguiococcus_pyrenoidosus.AAC.21